jgi:hypothetical protein
MKSLSAIHAWARGMIYGSLSFICGLVLGDSMFMEMGVPGFRVNVSGPGNPATQASVNGSCRNRALASK